MTVLWVPQAMQRPFPSLTVTDRHSAEVILKDHRSEVDWVLSLGGDSPAAGFETVAKDRRLWLGFDDLDRPRLGYQIPEMPDIESIIAFGARWAEGKLLVHCAAGQSRSTAAALLILAARYGSGGEATAVEHLFQALKESEAACVRPPDIKPFPNRRMVWLGDAALHRRGLLWSILVNRMPEGYVRGFDPPAW